MKKQGADIAIHLTNVSKRYTIHHEKPTLVGAPVGITLFRRESRYFDDWL